MHRRSEGGSQVALALRCQMTIFKYLQLDSVRYNAHSLSTASIIVLNHLAGEKKYAVELAEN